MDSPTMDTPLQVFHLTEFTITLSPGGHFSIPGDAQLYLQFALDDDIAVDTAPYGRESDKQVWKVKVSFYVPCIIPILSIGVMLKGAGQIDTQLASVDLTNEDIRAHERRSKFSRVLADVNIVLEFSVAHGPHPLGLPNDMDCRPSSSTTNSPHPIPPSPIMDALEGFHLTEFTITSSPSGHFSIPDDAQLYLQFTLDEDTIVKTESYGRESEKQVWKVKDSFDIPGAFPVFSIGIMLKRAGQIDSQLASVDLTNKDIRHMSGHQLAEFSRVIADLDLALDFTVAHRFHLSGTSNDTDHRTSSSTTNDGPPMSRTDFWAYLDLISGRTTSNNPERLNALRLLLEPDTEKRVALLNHLCSLFWQFYQNYQWTLSLNMAISLQEEIVKVTPPGHPENSTHLGYFLLKRIELLGDMADIDRSISLYEHAVKLTSDHNPLKYVYQFNLSLALYARFEHLGDIADLNKSILAREDAARLTIHDHPETSGILAGLSVLLRCRFEKLGDNADIDKSILVGENAVQLTPHDHPDRAVRLTNLYLSLRRRVHRLKQIADINKLTSVSEAAVQLTPDGHPDKFDRLNNQIFALLCRFMRLNDVAAMDMSITLLKDVVRLTPDGHPRQPMTLCNLGNFLLYRAIDVGNIPDIDQSISCFRKALRFTSDDHPDKPVFLHRLGNGLRARFAYFEGFTDFNESVSVYEKAVRLTPEHHRLMSAHLSSLGASLADRYSRLGDVADLERSISSFEEALRLLPDNDLGKCKILAELGYSLQRRHEVLGNIADLDKSISMLEQTIQPLREEGVVVTEYWTSLSRSLLSRMYASGEIADIHKSISMHQDALKLTPDGHYYKTLLLTGLVESFLLRYRALGNSADLFLARQQLCVAARSTTGPPLLRFTCACVWVQWQSALPFDRPSLLEACSVALTLLPQLAWLGLPLHKRHHKLIPRSLGMNEWGLETIHAGNLARNAASAAIEIRYFETAIEWLEQGRSVVWSQLLKLCTQVDELREIQPELAARYVQLSNELQRPRTPHLTLEVDAKDCLEEAAQRHRRVASEWEALVEKIRGIQGFERFLLPQAYSQLKHAAHSGPVVILNASAARCDALVMLPDLDDPLHIPLPALTESDAQELHSQLNTLLCEAGRQASWERACRRNELPGPDPNSLLKYILAQLWRNVVKPVLDSLAFPSPPDPSNLPRIWWCPNGPLAFLPIHAAGIYDESESEAGNCVSDFVISSYTPTLSALIDERQHGHTPSPDDFKLLIVAQSNAPGGAPLSGTQGEMDLIQKHAKSQAIASHPLKGTEATAESVLRHMQQSNWVHFACHGVQERETPTDSGLLLADGRLKLSAIIEQSLPNAELAFLSACQTATGTADLSEESVHLAAGILLAGYRGVVATMWSIGDEDAPRIADDFYAHVLAGERPDHTQAAFALHQAVQRLRSDGASFLSWVPYIHVGV